MFDTLYAQIGAIVMVAVGLFAFWKGDEPERVGASAYGFAWFAALLIQADSRLSGTQWAMFALDLVVLAVFGALAWKSRRAWPVWAAALQLVVVMSHIVIAIDLGTPMASFYTVLNLTSYGVLLCLAVGTFWAWQERRAAGLE
jgi:hypothetical protein